MITSLQPMLMVHVGDKPNIIAINEIHNIKPYGGNGGSVIEFKEKKRGPVYCEQSTEELWETICAVGNVGRMPIPGKF